MKLFEKFDDKIKTIWNIMNCETGRKQESYKNTSKIIKENETC